jgi:tetratricopeptide (TPR) repeat protein
MFGCFGRSTSTDGLAPFLKPESVSTVVKSKERGNEAYSKKNFSGAVAEYSRALSGFVSYAPTSATPRAEDIHLLSTILSNRSASYLNLKKYCEALEDAEHVIRWRPEWVKGYFRKAEVLYRKKDFLNALTMYKESLQRVRLSYLIDIEKAPSDRSLHQRVGRCKIAIEEQKKGFVIHQLLAGRDFCESSWMAPIQSMVFQFASQMRNFVYFICNLETMQCVVVDAVRHNDP